MHTEYFRGRGVGPCCPDKLQLLSAGVLAPSGCPGQQEYVTWFWLLCEQLCSHLSPYLLLD